MKNYFSILVITFLVAGCAIGNDKDEKSKSDTTTVSSLSEQDSVPKCDELLKLFHTVYLGKDRSIVLRNNISSLSEITHKLSSNYYSLNKGTFGVADSMAVEVNKDNQIIGITAAYNYAPEFSNDTAYIHEQRKYNKLICNSGREYSYQGKDTSFIVTRWEAGNIIFELIEANIKKKKEVYSVIFDKELYFLMLKPLFDAEGKDLSIEIQNRIGRVKSRS